MKYYMTYHTYADAFLALWTADIARKVDVHGLLALEKDKRLDMHI
jgi:hypothetical protein